MQRPSSEKAVTDAPSSYCITDSSPCVFTGSTAGSARHVVFGGFSQDFLVFVLPVRSFHSKLERVFELCNEFGIFCRTFAAVYKNQENMWLLLAFCSAALLGFYDVFKKKSLANNAVLPVLGLNTLFSSLIFLPFILVSYFHPEALQDTLFYVPSAGWEVHKFIILKSFIVLSSWTFGYFGMKHLP